MNPVFRLDVSDASKATASLVAAGDYCLWTPASRQVARGGPEALFHPDVLAVSRMAPLSTVNLECPLAAEGRVILKAGPALAGHPENAQLLRGAGFGVAILANNHILDYGPEALAATQALCAQAGLRTVGTGRNLEEAERFLVTEIGGLRVAIGAFAEHEFSIAGPRTPGSAQLDPVRMPRLIAQARASADLVILNVHGGNELYPLPSPRVQSWYRFLVECGAHAVVGHHPHVAQGIEIYRGSPIFYSLGNFCFDFPTPMPRAWKVSLLVRLGLGQGGVQSVEVFAVKQAAANGRIRIEPLVGEEAEGFEVRLRRLSELAADTDAVQKFWRCLAKEQSRGRLARLKFAAVQTSSDLLGLVKLGIKRRSLCALATVVAEVLGRYAARGPARAGEQAMLLHLLRCPSLHDLLTTILEMELAGSAPDPAAWSEYQQLMQECHL